jgi:two-component system, chemotaxis family, sensor kinase CheA
MDEVDLTKSFVVVCEVEKLRFGIVVDQVLQTEEIVAKPVSARLRHLACYSGATIMGDGSVIMILDPHGLVQKIGVTVEANNDNDVAEDAGVHAAERTPLLVFRAGPGSPKAVPLATVTRLEEIDVSTVEQANGEQLVQYRGHLMRLVTCNAETRLREKGVQPILVFARRSQPVGVVVDEIVDIVEDVLQIAVSGSTPGILGSTVISGRATDIIDIAHFIPELGGGAEEYRLRGRKRILLCEESDFVRAMLAPVLQSAGFDIHSVSSAEEAEARLAWGGYHIVVANIEEGQMLRLTDNAGPATRFIGLANRSSRDLLASAERAGFDDVVAIFDRQGLIASLNAADAALGDAA